MNIADHRASTFYNANSITHISPQQTDILKPRHMFLDHATHKQKPEAQVTKRKKAQIPLIHVPKSHFMSLNLHVSLLVAQVIQVVARSKHKSLPPKARSPGKGHTPNS
eukprot:TRINITY_DN387_c2_g1_i1.p1 TRINITY_DN387_c2_g1~~TRINITY_DN387_c2_g1_i1.p1  ORF type:complete len:108 (+),score=14.44 TRINITY_DN387_c2_g1_i1:846-1169(+)